MHCGAFFAKALPIVHRLTVFTLALALTLLCAGGTAIDADKTDAITGELLVASPDMKDPRFIETVIYIIKRNAEGTLGLVINRPLAKGPIEDLLKGLGSDVKGATGEIIIYYGGPVSAETGFILHTDDVLVDSSNEVKDGIAVTSDVKLLEAMARGKGPREALMIMGYAGWAPGQLEAELKAGAWFVVPADKAFIFSKDAENKWRRALDKRQIPL